MVPWMMFVIPCFFKENILLWLEHIENIGSIKKVLNFRVYKVYIHTMNIHTKAPSDLQPDRAQPQLVAVISHDG